MSDRPWLEDADPALRVERALLKRLNAEQPPAGSTDQGWAALAADISGLQALASGVGHVDPTPLAAQGAKSLAGWGLAAKIAVGVAVAGGLTWTGGQLLKSESPSISSRPQPQRSVAAEALPDAREQGAQGDTAEEPPAKTQQPGPARPATSATTLAEEGRLLTKAHQLVQAGQGQQALEVLRTSAARYPRSVLYQEREVLTIEALGATGASAAARQRAERFLKRHPNSAHAARLQRFVE